jgi:hypothetical protein
MVKLLKPFLVLFNSPIIYMADKPSTTTKLRISLLSALIFFLIASPYAYVLTEKIFGSLFTVSIFSCPTMNGLLLHTLVFFLIVLGLMYV